MHRRTLSVVAATVLLLAGCGSARLQGSATAAAIPAECPPDVQPYPDYRTGPHLPDDVQPVGVLRCVVTEEDDPATGRWRVVQTERATSGIEDYVAALRMSDEPRPTATCSAPPTSCSCRGPPCSFLTAGLCRSRCR